MNVPNDAHFKDRINGSAPLNRREMSLNENYY